MKLSPTHLVAVRRYLAAQTELNRALVPDLMAGEITRVVIDNQLVVITKAIEGDQIRAQVVSQPIEVFAHVPDVRSP